MEKISVPLSLAKYVNVFISSRENSILCSYGIKSKKLKNSASCVFASPLHKQTIIENDLHLLAQINLSEISSCLLGKNPLPSSGFLQFFVNPKQPNQTIVAYKNKLDFETFIYQTPYYPITFSIINELCPINDTYNSSYFYSSIIDKLSQNEKKQILEIDEFKNNNTKLLGYPYFIKHKKFQQDYDYENPLFLLFQFKNRGQFKSSVKYISWFIHKNDLENLDFSNILTIVQKKYKS